MLKYMYAYMYVRIKLQLLNVCCMIKSGSNFKSVDETLVCVY